MRSWYDPREGLSPFRAPFDYVVAAAFGVGNLMLCGIGYAHPPERIFDEVYFARAAHEYLINARIYENTHPPLSKLLVTASVWLFGGIPHGDTAAGWRFLDVCFASALVVVLYALAKRMTGSSLVASVAAALLTCDGMHFVQARIATPESFVCAFSLAATYAFYRFWIASQIVRRACEPGISVRAAVPIAAACAAVCAALAVAWGHGVAATAVIAGYAFLGAYAGLRSELASRLRGAANELTFPDGSRAVTGGPHAGFWAPGGVPVGRARRYACGDDELTIRYDAGPRVRYETPAGSADYDADGLALAGTPARTSGAFAWIGACAFALGCLVSTKWYGVTLVLAALGLLVAIWGQPALLGKRPAVLGNPHAYHLDATIATFVFAIATVYGSFWIPDLVRRSPDPAEIHSFDDVVARQYAMFEYHDVSVAHATHPYSSKWWEWPLDYVPVAYYYDDARANRADPAGCCILEITSMPNPIVLWFGLAAVPIVGWLGWREKRKGYLLLAVTYCAQWIPWAASPRLAWEYHFYVNIPIVCLCDAIALQRLWLWGATRNRRTAITCATAAVAFVVCAIAAFSFFYPVLAARPLTWHAWQTRMWLPTWVIGPG